MLKERLLLFTVTERIFSFCFYISPLVSFPSHFHPLFLTESRCFFTVTLNYINFVASFYSIYWIISLVFFSHFIFNSTFPFHQIHSRFLFDFHLFSLIFPLIYTEIFYRNFIPILFFLTTFSHFLLICCIIFVEFHISVLLIFP